MPGASSSSSSAHLLKVLSEDHPTSAFEKPHDIGCMKGIFQIFQDHHHHVTFSGRHYGSKRLTSENAGGGKSLPAATSDDTIQPQHHRRHSISSSSCTMQQAASFHNSKQLNPAMEYAAAEEEDRHHHHHHWSSVDSNGKKLATKPLADPAALDSSKPQQDQEPPDVNNRPHLSFYFRKPTTPTVFQNSKLLPKDEDDGSQHHVDSFSGRQEGANNWGAATAHVTTPRASVDRRQVKQSIPTVKTSSSSLEIKGHNVLCQASSFYRDKEDLPQGLTDHNPCSINRAASRQSLNLEEVSSALPTLKKLTRSVSGRDKLQDFPSSNEKLSPSVGHARLRSRSYVERSAAWRQQQDSMMMEFPSSGSLQETDTKPDPRLSIMNNLKNLQRSFDGNDSISGLKLSELQQDCHSWSISKEDRRISPHGWGTTLLPAVRPDNTSHFKKQANCVVLGSDIKDTMRSVVSESKVSIQASEQKERVWPHCSVVDGTRDSPRVFFPGGAPPPPRLSVDGRDHVINRENYAELQENSSEGMLHRGGGPSVVARLMGLEELPCSSPPSLQKVLHMKPPSREAKLIQGLLRDSSPPRLLTTQKPSLRPKSDNSASLQEDQGAHLPTRNQVEGFQEPMPRPKSPLSPKHLLIDGMPPIFFRQKVAHQQDTLKTCHPHLKKAQFMEAVERPGRMPLDMNPSPSPEPLLHGGLAQQLQQLRLRKLVQERKSLKKILETMQLKGLLHPSPSKHPTVTNFFPDSKPILLPKVAITNGSHLAQMDLAGEYQESPEFGEAQITMDTMDTKRQEHRLVEGLLNAARTVGHEKLGDTCTMMIRPISTKPTAVGPRASNPSPALPVQSMELDCMLSKSGSSGNLVMADTPHAHTNDGGTMKRASVKTGSQRSCQRLQQPKGNVEMPKGTAAESSPRTPRSPQVGNLKPVVTSPRLIREQPSPRARSPSQAVAFGSGSKRLMMESSSSQELQSPRPGSPSQGVAFGGGTKWMLETVRSPQPPKSVPQSQASEELVKGLRQNLCMGPESPRVKRPSSVLDSKSTSSRVHELHPQNQSLKDPVDVSTLKSKQLNIKLAKGRLVRRSSQPMTENPTMVTASSQATVEKCSELRSRSLVPRRLSFGPDQSTEVVKDLVSEETTTYAQRNNHRSLDVKTQSSNFLVKQAGADSKPECDFDSEANLQKQVQSTEVGNVDRSQGIKLPMLSIKCNLGGDLSTSASCVSSRPQHQGLEETGDMLMGLEERKLVVWSEKRPSKVDFTAHKDLLFEKCMNFSENDQMGDPSSKQPSPMSVLDNTFFRDEETCTVITPRVEEHILQEALLALENIRRSRSFAKTLINKQPPPPPPPLSVNSIEIMSEGVFGTSPGEEDKHEIVLREEEEEPPPAGPDNCCNRSVEREFVRELLIASGLTKSYDDDDADIFEDLERYNEDSRKRSRKSGQLQHCLLLDTVNEILARKHELENSYCRVYMPISQKKKNLMEEVWEQMQGMMMMRSTTCAADDVYDTVQRILERDLLESKNTNAAAPQAESWAHDYRLELSKLEVGLEQMIFKDLMDEAVEELKTCFGNSSSSSSKNCCSCCCCCCCCFCCHQQQQQQQHHHHQHHPPRLRGSASCSRNSLQFPKKATARRQLLFMH